MGARVENVPARRPGFTLVELIIVIVVIAILATIVAFGTGYFLEEGRNSQRAASATSLAEALEKYYDENGEYPSCPMMTANAATVGDTLRVDQQALKMPTGNSDNSITCADLPADSGSDVLAYVGDTSSQCRTGQACVSWVLKYKPEGSDAFATITSRRTGTVATAPAAPASNVTAVVADSMATGVASGVLCSNGTAEYRLSSQVNTGSWTTSDWSADRTLSLPAAEGSRYSYKADTRCVLRDGTLGDNTGSNTASVIYPITAPDAPVLTASATGAGTADSVTWSWAAASCPAGTTAEYSTAYFRDDATGWRSWASPSTALNYPYATNYQGYEYQVKAKARCKSNYIASDYSADSNQPSYIRAISTPGAASGFHISKETKPSPAGGGTYGNPLVWWDTVPTCGLGTSRRAELFGWQNVMSPVMPSPQWAGGGNGYVWSTDASTPQSDLVSPSNTSSGQEFNRQEYRWRTAWQDTLLPRYRDPESVAVDNPSNSPDWRNWSVDSAHPYYPGSSVAYGDGNSTYVRGTRAYVRYACLNVTTGRSAIGAPALTGWQQW